MKLADKIKAVHALRTTTAKQIRFELSDGKDGRCANGVLCDAFGIATEGPEEDSADWAPYEDLADLGIPTSEIWQRNDGRYDVRVGRVRGLHTFAQIADWIEANVPVDDDPTVEIEHYANTAPVLVGV